MSLTRPTLADGASRSELAVELLKAYRHYVGAALLVAVGAVLYFQPTIPSVSISREWRVAGVAVASAGILGYLPAAKALDWLYDPPRRYVVSLGFSGGEPGVWELSPSAWAEVDVTEGRLYQWQGTKWPVYEAEWFNPESLTAKGTWRGSKSDSELLRKEKELTELREELEPQANTSIDTELQIASRVRQAVKEIGRAIIDEHASATTYEGERVADVLSDIRRDVEEDAGDPEPQRNGEKPTTSRDLDAVETLEQLADVAQEAPADD